MTVKGRHRTRDEKQSGATWQCTSVGTTDWISQPGCAVVSQPPSPHSSSRTEDCTFHKCTKLSHTSFGFDCAPLHSLPLLVNQCTLAIFKAPAKSVASVSTLSTSSSHTVLLRADVRSHWSSGSHGPPAVLQTLCTNYWMCGALM